MSGEVALEGLGTFAEQTLVQGNALTQGKTFTCQVQERVVISCFADGSLFSLGDCDATVTESFCVTGTLTN